jgi:hypothetical protein
MKIYILPGWATHESLILKQLPSDLPSGIEIEILDWREVVNPNKIKQVKALEGDVIVAWSLGAHGVTQISGWEKVKIRLMAPALDFCGENGCPERILKRMIAKLKQDPEWVLKDFAQKMSYFDSEEWVKCALSYGLETLTLGLEALISRTSLLQVEGDAQNIRVYVGSQDLICLPLGLQTTLKQKSWEVIQTEEDHGIEWSKLLNWVL